MNATTILPFPVKYDSYALAQSEYEVDHGDDGFADEMSSHYLDHLLASALRHADAAATADDRGDKSVRIRQTFLCARYLRDALGELAHDGDVDAHLCAVRECEELLGHDLDEWLADDIEELTESDIPSFG